MARCVQPPPHTHRARIRRRSCGSPACGTSAKGRHIHSNADSRPSGLGARHHHVPIGYRGSVCAEGKGSVDCHARSLAFAVWVCLGPAGSGAGEGSISVQRGASAAPLARVGRVGSRVNATLWPPPSTRHTAAHTSRAESLAVAEACAQCGLALRACAGRAARASGCEWRSPTSQAPASSCQVRSCPRSPHARAVLTPPSPTNHTPHTRTCAREIGRGRAAGSAAPGARRLTQPAQRRAALRLHAAPLGTGLHVRGRIEGLCGRD